MYSTGLHNQMLKIWHIESEWLGRFVFFCFSRKLRQVLTSRILKFFADKAKKDPLTYRKFYDDYGLFFREGIVTTPEQDQRVRWLYLVLLEKHD